MFSQCQAALTATSTAKMETATKEHSHRKANNVGSATPCVQTASYIGAAARYSLTRGGTGLQEKFCQCHDSHRCEAG
ncbi:hypothetical protein OKW42_006695 [Paraburkholderia sp. WC7.3d]